MSATIEVREDDGALVVFKPDLHVDPALIQRGEHEGAAYFFTPDGLVASMGGDATYAFLAFKLDGQTLGSMRIPWSAIRAGLAAKPEARQ